MENLQNEIASDLHLTMKQPFEKELNPLMHNVPKWSDTLKMLQDFESVSDHFGTLCIKGLTVSKKKVEQYSRNFT